MAIIKTYSIQEDEIIIQSQNDQVSAFILNRTVNAIIKRKKKLASYGYKFPKQIILSPLEAIAIALDFVNKSKTIKKDNRINSLYSFHVFTDLQDKVIAHLPNANMVKLVFPNLAITGINAINSRKIRLAKRGIKVVKSINFRVERANQELRKLGWKPGYIPFFQEKKLKFRKPTKEDKQMFIVAKPSKKI